MLLPELLKEKPYGFLSVGCDFCLKVDITTNWSGGLELIHTNIYECLWCISETNGSLLEEYEGSTQQTKQALILLTVQIHTKHAQRIINISYFSSFFHSLKLSLGTVYPDRDRMGHLFGYVC